MVRVNGAGRGILAGAFGLIAITALSGCADFERVTHLTPLSVDPSSPVAADVQKAELTNGPIPSFTTVPPKPTDVPTAAAYKRRVVSLVGDRRTFAKWEKDNPPGVTDTETFAEAQRGKLADQTPVSDDQQAKSEAFVRQKTSEAQAPQDKTPKKTPPVAASPY